VVEYLPSKCTRPWVQTSVLPKKKKKVTKEKASILKTLSLCVSGPGPSVKDILSLPPRLTTHIPPNLLWPGRHTTGTTDRLHHLLASGQSLETVKRRDLLSWLLSCSYWDWQRLSTNGRSSVRCLATWTFSHFLSSRNHSSSCPLGLGGKRKDSPFPFGSPNLLTLCKQPLC
jgi:hypothetical protein